MGGIFMDKYRCIVCGYVYDPAVGDKTQDILPGVTFDELPEDWICPMCEVDKTDFEKI